MNARSRPGEGAASDLAGSGINTDSTALLELSEWAERRNSVVAWLPHATREAVEAFALRHFERAESAAFLIAEQTSEIVGSPSGWRPSRSRRPSTGQHKRPFHRSRHCNGAGL